MTADMCSLVGSILNTIQMEMILIDLIGSFGVINECPCEVFFLNLHCIVTVSFEFFFVVVKLDIKKKESAYL